MTQALAALAALPDRSHEDWRYTDLAPLKARRWSDSPGERVEIEFDPDGYATKVVTLGEAEGTARLLTHRIALPANRHATLVLHETGGPAQCLALHNIEIELAPGASLDLFRVQQPGARTNLISRLDARLDRDARLNCIAVHAGGALVRNDVNIALLGPGASAELHGVMAPAAGEHLDVHTRLDHRAPHGTSRETFRCLVPAKARAVFNGKVIVHPGAQKTDSEQHVDSLLLAPGAEVDAKPDLEIYADDVKCAHGATCGQLDETALYYLRTRGLDREAARQLLLRTFAHAVLDRIAFAPARELAERALESAVIPRSGATRELVP